MKPLQALAQWFNTLAARERAWVVLCASIVLLAALWWLAIAPALATLRSAPQVHHQLDAQLQSMQALATQAGQLKSQRALSQEEIMRNLESSVKQSLGAGATLSTGDGRASLILKGVNADALALWFAQARANARVVPLDAKLTRSVSSSTPAGTATTATTATAVTNWDGVMNLALPGNK